MKKIFMVAIALIATSVGYSQTSVSVLYGVNSTVADRLPGAGSYTDLVTWHHYLITEVKGGKKLVYGLGIGIPLNSGAVGEHYTVIDWTHYPNDVYQKITGPNASFYGILGYRVIKEMMSINFNFGILTNETFYNARDPFKILSPNGYYYTSESAKSTSLFGASIQMIPTKNLSVDIGLDNVHGFKIGLGYAF